MPTVAPRALTQQRFDLDPEPHWHALQIYKALKASDVPTIDPPAPVEAMPLPSAWLLAWCPVLSPPAQALLVHLAYLSQRFSGRIANRWFWRPDADLGDHRESGLIRQTGLSPRSLARARAELATAEVLFRTTHARPGTATWYALRWPPPLPPWVEPDAADVGAARDADRRRTIVAAEIQKGGAPWAPSSAWARLCRAQAGDDGAYAADNILTAASPTQMGAALDFLDQLRDGAWLRRQLTWGIPELVADAVSHGR